MAIRKLCPPKMRGDVEIRPILQPEEMFGKNNMYARVRMPRGSEIGWHVHTGEIEVYYVLSGTGEYTDSDGTKSLVSSGDVCTMTLGGGHAMRQIGEMPLEFMALIMKTE